MTHEKPKKQRRGRGKGKKTLKTVRDPEPSSKESLTQYEQNRLKRDVRYPDGEVPLAEGTLIPSGNGFLKVFRCKHCHIKFVDKASGKNRSVYCSRDCMGRAQVLASVRLKEYKKEMRKQAKMEAAAKALELSPERMSRLTPAHAQKLRALIGGVTRDQIKEAHLVVMGKTTWTSTQASVFRTMLNKVVPDLNHSFVQQENDPDKPVSELTREELEAIVARAQARATPVDDAEPLNSDHYGEILDAEVIPDEDHEPSG